MKWCLAWLSEQSPVIHLEAQLGAQSRKAEDAVSVSTVGSQDHRYPQLQLNADANQDLAKLSVLEQSLLRFMFPPHRKFQMRCQEWCLEHFLAEIVFPPPLSQTVFSPSCLSPLLFPRGGAW